MSTWGSLPSGISDVTSCKACGKGTMPENFAALVAANNVNTNFSYEGSERGASTSNNNKGIGGIA